MRKEEWALKKQKLLKQFNYKCYYCGKALNIENLSVDHILPRSQGGTNHMANLAASCHECNNKKGNKRVWDELSNRMFGNTVPIFMKVWDRKVTKGPRGIPEIINSVNVDHDSVEYVVFVPQEHKDLSRKIFRPSESDKIFITKNGDEFLIKIGGSIENP